MRIPWHYAVLVHSMQSCKKSLTNSHHWKEPKYSQLNTFFFFLLSWSQLQTSLILLPFISREEAAIKDLQRAMKDTEIGGRSEGAHIHIVHLSDAKTSLGLLKVWCHYQMDRPERINDSSVFVKSWKKVLSQPNKRILYSQSPRTFYIAYLNWLFIVDEKAYAQWSTIYSNDLWFSWSIYYSNFLYGCRMQNKMVQGLV